MAKFIEVTTRDNMKHLINVKIIEEVRINWDGGVDIYLAFNCPHTIEQDCISTKESYSEVKKMLLGGAKNEK